MAQYTITTLPEHELSLASIVSNANDVIDTKNKTSPNDPAVPHITAADYLAARVKDMLDSWSASYGETLLTIAMTKYAAASSDTRKQILTALGMASYAVLPIQQQMEVLKYTAISAFKKLNAATKAAVFTSLGME